MTQSPPEKDIFSNEQLRKEYRSRVAAALRLASTYTGKQDEYQAVMKTLVDLERWMIDTFDSQHEQGGLPEGFEQKVMEAWQDGSKKTRRSVDSLLGLSHRRYEHFLASALNTFKEDDSLLKVTLDDLILPPGQGRGILEGDGTNLMEEPRFQERIKDLLITLEGVGIYSDDVINNTYTPGSAGATS